MGPFKHTLDDGLDIRKVRLSEVVGRIGSRGFRFKRFQEFEIKKIIYLDNSSSNSLIVVMF